MNFLSIFPRFDYRNSVRNLSVWSRVFTIPLCACGFVHPQALPLIVSSHLLNIPLIVSWLNIIICNRACTEIWILQSFRNSTSRSFYLFLSIFFQCLLGVVSNLRLFAVDISSVWLSKWYSFRIIASVHRPALRLRIRPMFARFCDGHSFITCRCLFGFLSTYDRVCSLARSARADSSTHKRYHLCNVPLIVSWLNIVIYNRACSVI